MIKVVHTLVWAIFAGCIVAMPLASRRGEHRTAARYTDDRHASFDIYLPEWLARHSTLIFGALYCAGVVVTIARWVRAGLA